MGSVGHVRRRAGPEDDGEREEATQNETVAVRPGKRVTIDGEP
jgi:hypothetical protein